MKKIIKCLICVIVVQAVLVSCMNSESGEIQESAPPEAAEVAVNQNISSEEAWNTAENYMMQMTIDERIGQLFFVKPETLEPSKGSDHHFKKVTKKLNQSMMKYPVGGILLTFQNMKSEEQIKKLVSGLKGVSGKIPLYIAAEEAGGANSIFAGSGGLAGSTLPGYPELGRTKTPEEMAGIAETVGNKLDELGFNMNFAPSADVADEAQESFYAEGCFSSDGGVAADMVAASVEGMKNSGIGTMLKHFPGIGSVPDNTDIGIINMENSLTHMREVDFVPFQAGIDAGADMVLVSHVAVTRLTENIVPSSMSDVIIQDILRQELAFEGVIITDAMNLPVITSHYNSAEAVLKALAAGADMILMPENLEMAFQAVKQAVTDQTISMERLDEAVTRILQNKIMQGILLKERA